MKKIIIGSLSVIALVLLMLFILGVIGRSRVSPGNTSIATVKLETAIKTIKVNKQWVDDVLSWPGTVRSQTKVHISPKITARILTIAVKSGDKVKRGDVIATLDQRAIKAREREAYASLNAAKADAERFKADEKRIRELYAKQAATRQTFDKIIAQSRASEARVDAAASALREIRVNQAETTLKAPFDGIIVKRLMEPGDMALAGMPLAVIHNSAALRLEVAVPTQCARRIKLGNTVAVRIETLGADNLTGLIDEIVPEVDADTRTILIKASLPRAKGLQPGLFGWLDQACSRHEALLLPEKAVLKIGQLEIVKVLVDGKVLTRHIRTGETHGKLIEVQSGLRAGETVILPGQETQ